MSEMIEVKTSALTGSALDWAVARVDKVKTIMMPVRQSDQKKPFALFGSLALPLASEEGYAPSSCWHCGGPLIDKHLIEFTVEHPNLIFAALMDENGMPVIATEVYGAFGETYLIAASRALVLTKIGDAVKVPAELVQPLNPA